MNPGAERLIDSLDQHFNSDTLPERPVGFAVLVFIRGADPLRVRHVSNSEHDEVVAAVRQWLAQDEGAAP